MGEDAARCRCGKGRGALGLPLIVRERFLADTDGPAPQAVAVMLKPALSAQRVDEARRDVEDFRSALNGEHDEIDLAKDRKSQVVLRSVSLNND